MSELVLFSLKGVDKVTTLLYTSALPGRVYTLVRTEKGYTILKERVVFLDGMQLRFLYDVEQGLAPDLDVVPIYFESLHDVEELISLELIVLRPQRAPGAGEKRLLTWEGILYYGWRASAFRAELTQEGRILLEELKKEDIFSECMEEMDKKMAETLLAGRTL